MLNGTSASSRLMSRGDVQCVSPVASYRGAGMSIPETHSLLNFNNVRNVIFRISKGEQVLWEL